MFREFWLWFLGYKEKPTERLACESFDMVRLSAQEFLDALDAATEQAWETGDEDKMNQCEALAAYVANKLEHYK